MFSNILSKLGFGGDKVAAAEAAPAAVAAGAAAVTADNAEAAPLLLR